MNLKPPLTAWFFASRQDADSLMIIAEGHVEVSTAYFLTPPHVPLHWSLVVNGHLETSTVHLLDPIYSLPAS